jgi:inhibitor of KinA
VYDLAQIKPQHGFSSSFEWIKATIIQHIESINTSDLIGRHVKIPVCYDIALGLDLFELSQHSKLSIEEIIDKHSSQTYKVYMIGFLPGFPYMATVDVSIQMNRRAVPRQIVPKGSVGIAGEQTGIYPLDSPGGWQIIGQTPLNLFDISKENPCLLSPGDRVEFYAISLEEFWEIKKAINA